VRISINRYTITTTHQYSYLVGTIFAATDVVIDGSFVVAGIGNGIDGTIDVTFEAELGSLLVSRYAQIRF
jgi:hypothetical protein